MPGAGSGSDTMADEAALALQVFHAQGHAILVTDAAGLICAVNRTFERTTGYTKAEVLGKNPRLLKSGVHDAAFYDDLWHTLRRSGVWEGEIVNRRKNGETYTERLTISAVRGATGDVESYVGVFSDISHRKEAEARIEHLAHHDPLTDLPNRLLLRKRAAAAFGQSKLSRRQAAVLFVDLDHFKDVNDSLGHDAGDFVLRDTARRLAATVRVSDTVCRQGGDEFIILLAEIRTPEDAGSVAAKLLAALEAPFSVGGNDVNLAASVGIALHPDDGTDLDALLRHADAAMYAAKAAGRGRYQFYSSEMNARSSERRIVVSDLRDAIEGGHLGVVYQPHVELRTGRIVGVEALVRWNHPTRGPLTPAQFVGVAEGAGLAAALDAWVLRQACGDARRLHDAGAAHLRLVVNISGIHFAHSEFVGTVENILRETGLHAGALRFELRESVLSGRNGQAAETARRLDALGVRLGVDDFGTGYSSLAELTRLPIENLAVDGALCQGLGTRPADATLIRAIADFARVLGLSVRVKQVERPEQAEVAATIGCDAAQGFHFGAPAAFEQIATMTRRAAEATP